MSSHGVLHSVRQLLQDRERRPIDFAFRQIKIFGEQTNNMRNELSFVSQDD